MGKIVLAAKCTHAPGLLRTEEDARRKAANAKGVYLPSHDVESLGTDYHKLVPTHCIYRDTAEVSCSDVLVIASDPLNHKFWPKKDHAARNGSFPELLPDYANFCCGEGSMHDKAMLYGALGWDRYAAPCEVVTEFFPSSGTGQTNVIFPAT